MKPPLTLEFLRSTYKRNYSLLPNVYHMVCLQVRKLLKIEENTISPYCTFSNTKK